MRDRTGAAGEVVGARLTWEVREPERDHVLARLVRGTEVDLATLVDHEDLVELLVDAFSSLFTRILSQPTISQNPGRGECT